MSNYNYADKIEGRIVDQKIIGFRSQNEIEHNFCDLKVDIC